MPINRKEAPKGCKAVPEPTQGDKCKGCCYIKGNFGCKASSTATSCGGNRKDGCMVIFKKIKAEPKIVSKDAPKGFKAIPETAGCNGCHFDSADDGCGLGTNSCITCYAGDREDKKGVIFIKLPGAKPTKKVARIDPNEAPVGYKAVEDSGCQNCYFDKYEHCPGGIGGCQPETRKDGVSVIFKKNTNPGVKLSICPIPAPANYVIPNKNRAHIDPLLETVTQDVKSFMCTEKGQNCPNFIQSKLKALNSLTSLMQSIINN